MKFYIASMLLATSALIAGRGSAQEIPRTIPPAGVKVPAADREALGKSLEKLEQRVRAAKSGGKVSADREHLWADVEIYLKAVRYALEDHEFFNAREVGYAKAHLQTAEKRLDALLGGEAPWAEARKLVVRGYRSKLDGSVQPYGLVIPEKLPLDKPVPLIVWLHGRGNTLSEVNFIQQHERSAGQVAPDWAMVLHVYGRYCNAFKFAGEVDVFEAIEDVKKRYKIDADRIVLWGFSMGGAGAWHLGAHYADYWVAVSPGAGFAETARYQHLKPEDYPVWYEQTLWGLFDVPDYARNLLNVPLVAYSGEIDKQKQAADVMEEALAANGYKLHHLIGPGMGHKYHPDTLAELTKLMHGYAQLGRNPFPLEAHLQTRTLRYHKMFWVELLGMGKHWEDARVDAKLIEPARLAVSTRNATALRLTWPAEKKFSGRTVEIDSQKFKVADDAPPHAQLVLEKVDGHWRENAKFGQDAVLRKVPGLQGPIDDGLMDPFLVVVPSGTCANEKVQQWVDAELAHFQDRWRRLFRGDAVIKKDTEVTAADMQSHNLILWGDTKSNRLIAQLAGKLPIRWTASGIEAGNEKFNSAGHVPVLIYPNVLTDRPERYVVINSGITFREAHDRTNSLQNPKLPDWAVIDLSSPRSATAPGNVVAAGFFDERWKYQPRQTAE